MTKTKVKKIWVDVNQKLDDDMITKVGIFTGTFLILAGLSPITGFIFIALWLINLWGFAYYRTKNE